MACINSYYINLDMGLSREEAADQLQNYQVTQTQDQKTRLREKNDFAVLYIYKGDYTKAIQILHEVEKEFPKQAKTAANLGTAYELAGQLDKSYQWIKEGMLRDPNIHLGSEWIHLKILEAHQKLQKDSDWLKKNDVLGLDFGNATVPYPKVSQVTAYGKTYNLATILEHGAEQMVQRTQFLAPEQQEPVSAQIVFNLANIEFTNENYFDADLLYNKAQRLGFSPLSLLEQRMQESYTDNAWVRFKQKVIKIWLGFLAWWSSD